MKPSFVALTLVLISTACHREPDDSNPIDLPEYDTGESDTGGGDDSNSGTDEAESGGGDDSSSSTGEGLDKPPRAPHDPPDPPPEEPDLPPEEPDLPPEEPYDFGAELVDVGVEVAADQVAVVGLNANGGNIGGLELRLEERGNVLLGSAYDDAMLRIDVDLEAQRVQRFGALAHGEAAKRALLLSELIDGADLNRTCGQQVSRLVGMCLGNKGDDFCSQQAKKVVCQCIASAKCSD